MYIIGDIIILRHNRMLECICISCSASLSIAQPLPLFNHELDFIFHPVICIIYKLFCEEIVLLYFYSFQLEADVIVDPLSVFINIFNKMLYLSYWGAASKTLPKA